MGSDEKRKKGKSNTDVYKAVNGFNGLEKIKFIHMGPSIACLRLSNSHKLTTTKVIERIPNRQFLLFHESFDWNRLTNSQVNGISVNTFKAKVDNLWDS